MPSRLLTRTAPVLALVLGIAVGTAGAATAAPTRLDAPASAPSAAPSSPSPAGPEAATSLPRTVSRVDGRDRYAVSVAASRAAFATGTHPPVVYLVSGASPWHALSATSAAVHRNGGVLMTRPDGIPAVVAAELERLEPASVVVVGNTAAVSDLVLDQARRYTPDVRRVGGATRYQSSQALVRSAFAPGTVGRAWLSTGESWGEAIAGGSAAASQQTPLLAVDGRARTLPDDTVALIRELGITSITIAGAPTSVSAGIQTQLTGILGPGAVARASGSDDYAIAARVTRLAHPAPSAGPAYAASGGDVASALTGGFLAGHAKAPFALTLPYCVPAPARPVLASPRVTAVVLVGGERSVRGLVGTVEACHSIENPSSTWVLVNKKNPLAPKAFTPTRLVVPAVDHPNGQRLRSDAAATLTRMFAAAQAEGAGRMSITSGYRSFSSQKAVYRHRVSTHGAAYADRWIARPGHSEHQSGLALDIAPLGRATCASHTCLGSTPQGAWVRKNAWRFGFVLRYESGSTPVNGYNGEPWHIRFVGTPLSTAYHRGGWHTLEQFLAEPAAPSY